jgi:hypothetical protein
MTRFGLALLLLVSLCGVSPAAEIHVAPTGSDEQTGTQEAPVQSLEKARLLAQEARKANANEAVSILLHPGTYPVRKTVAFRPEDAGTAEAPLNILAWQDPATPDARPVLVGGAVVTGWRKSAFNGLANVFEADLQPLGITTSFKQVYLNGRRLTWARYPN